MLRARRLIIVAIIGVAFVYSTAIDASRSLASIGLIAFAGVANYRPGPVATVAFGFANARAARAGLVGGLTLGSYCLMLPSIGDDGARRPARRRERGLAQPARHCSASCSAPPSSMAACGASPSMSG